MMLALKLIAVVCSHCLATNVISRRHILKGPCKFQLFFNYFFLQRTVFLFFCFFKKLLQQALSFIFFMLLLNALCFQVVHPSKRILYVHTYVSFWWKQYLRNTLTAILQIWHIYLDSRINWWIVVVRGQRSRSLWPHVYPILLNTTSATLWGNFFKCLRGKWRWICHILYAKGQRSTLL